MATDGSDANTTNVRGQISEANSSLHAVARETARLWRRGSGNVIEEQDSVRGKVA